MDLNPMSSRQENRVIGAADMLYMNYRKSLCPEFRQHFFNICQRPVRIVKL